MPNNYRALMYPEMVPYFDANDKFFMIGMDTGFGRVEVFDEKRRINGGIMEQGIVGIASGMAAKGLIPIILSIPNFMALRALEQIRNDIVLQSRNVKIIGSGANNYFSFLGESHCCGNLDKDIFNLIGLRVFDGTAEDLTENDFKFLIKEFMESDKAGYLRV